MKVLLDTHTFLWADSDPEKLSSHVQETLSNTLNERLLSVASLWEIQIKEQLGKLSLRIPLPRLVAEQVERNQINLVPIVPRHVFELANLPPIHRDPFDRLIASVAIVEDATLLSRDQIFHDYPIEVKW